MQEATDGPSTSHPPQTQESDSDEDLFEQVEAFEWGDDENDVLEEIDCYQGNEGKQLEETSSHPHQSSTNEGPSTNGTHFVYSDWVSHISVKRLKYLAHEFYLPVAILKPSPNDRLHIPSPHMAAFSEAIIRERVSLPLHPFIDYFNIAFFQFTPNSICTMVAFYIAFMEADIGEPSAIEFAYVYYIKALVRNEGFWYTSK